MPLMVDPSSGNAITSISPSESGAISTFVPTGTPPAATVTAAAPSSTGLNMTQVIAQQAADQANVNLAMPNYLWLAIAVLLVLCMLLAHPRFLARVFASFHRRNKQEKQEQMDYVFAKANASGAGPEMRIVGGGGLKEGWILKREKSPTRKNNGWSQKYEDEEKNPFDDPTSIPIAPKYFPPPHISPAQHNLPWSTKLLYAPFSKFPGVFKSSITLARIYFVLAYFAFIAVCLIWKVDMTPATKEKGMGGNSFRAGYITVAQLPLVVALGVRGNLLGLCVGLGYEKMKVFHKIIGRTVFISCAIHVGAILAKWVSMGKFSTYAVKPFAISGFIAFGSICLIAITAMPWIRKACYGVFEICHFIGMIGVLVGTAFHVDAAVPYCIASGVIYGISILASICKTKVVHAELIALPDSNTTIVTIPSITSGWRAGQHLRIRVPALGLSHGFESHPFSAASAPDSGGLVLMCKNAGNWTAGLYDLANRNPSLEQGQNGTTATMIIEGPYGGLGNTMIPSFSSVLLVAGGSGISYALGIAHDLITKAPSGQVRARTVDLVWIVRTEDVARPVMPTLLDLLSQAKTWENKCLEARRRGGNKARPTALRIKIFVSRCPSSSPLDLVPINPFQDDSEENTSSDGHGYRYSPGGGGLNRQPSSAAEKEKFDYLSRNPSSASTATTNTSYFTTNGGGRWRGALSSISATPGKPDIPLYLDSLVTETIARHGRSRTNANGVILAACGPGGLVDDARRAVIDLEDDKRSGVGGVEFEQEVFGL